MGLFSRRKAAANTQALQLLAKLDGRLTSYVVQRIRRPDGSPDERVLGKAGRIMAPGAFVGIMAGDREVFHCDELDTVQCSELMSLNGAVITGRNTITGEIDTVVAHYQYYR